jgi:hypothetical protein
MVVIRKIAGESIASDPQSLQYRQHRSVDAGTCVVHWQDGRPQRVDSTPQACRQHLFQLDHGAQSLLLDTANPSRSGSAQCDSDCKRLVIVEEQRRQGPPWPKGIPAGYCR